MYLTFEWRLLIYARFVVHSEIAAPIPPTLKMYHRELQVREKFHAGTIMENVASDPY